MAKLYDLAKVLRSKNSGPFSITLDALFDDRRIYEYIRDSGMITRERIAGLYNLTPEMITTICFFDAAQGFKITFDRKVPSGTCFDTDVYGSQQHAPLGAMEIELPW